MKTYFLFVILSILTSCSMQETEGVSVGQALSMAGKNRAELEPVSDMRRELMGHYLPLIDSGKARNAFEACMIINKRLMNDLKYKENGQLKKTWDF